MNRCIFMFLFAFPLFWNADVFGQEEEEFPEEQEATEDGDVAARTRRDPERFKPTLYDTTRDKILDRRLRQKQEQYYYYRKYRDCPNCEQESPEYYYETPEP